MSALLRSRLVRWSSVSTAVALAMTTAIPVAGAAGPAPGAEPAPAAIEPAPAAVEPAPADFEVLFGEGDRLVAEGKPAEGAKTLADAYLAMPADVRVSDRGKHVVVTASNAYEAAWQATADAGQLEANQVLLKAYFADLDTARAAGQATSPADEHEQALRDRSTGIDRMLAEVRKPAEPAPAAPAPVLDPAAIEPQQALTFPPPDPRERRKALVLVGVGAAGTVVGGIMVIAGAVAASRAEEERRSMPTEEAGDARSAKVGGALVATTGALLFSGAVMMLGVGSNRLGDLRRDVAMSLRPTLGGVVLRGRF